MFFDVQSLVEWLNSSAWSWTTDACDRVLASFGLQEASSGPVRRQFGAPSGLRAYVYPGLDASPERIEFPFALPDTLRGNQAAINLYVDLVAHPLKPGLGEPVSTGHGNMRSWSWSLPTGHLTVGPDATNAAAVQNVALILQRPGAR